MEVRHAWKYAATWHSCTAVTTKPTTYCRGYANSTTTTKVYGCCNIENILTAYVNKTPKIKHTINTLQCILILKKKKQNPNSSKELQTAISVQWLNRCTIICHKSLNKKKKDTVHAMKQTKEQDRDPTSLMSRCGQMVKTSLAPANRSTQWKCEQVMRIGGWLVPPHHRAMMSLTLAGCCMFVVSLWMSMHQPNIYSGQRGWCPDR